VVADLAELPEQEVGGYLQTLPPQSTRGVADDGESDDMLDDLEGLLSNESQTRFLPVGGIKVSQAYKNCWLTPEARRKQIWERLRLAKLRKKSS